MLYLINRDWFLHHCYFESRLVKDKIPPIEASLPDCSYESSPMRANTGSISIYKKNPRSWKTRNESNIYKSFELCSILAVVFNPKKTSFIIECIYKYTSLNVNEFNDDYVDDLLHKLSKEDKLKLLLGDFNINLLNYDINPQTNNFPDSFLSHCFLPYIIQLMRLKSNFKTWIDIFFFLIWLFTI